MGHEDTGHQSFQVASVPEKWGAADRLSRRIARFSPEIISELPDVRPLRVDVNGILAGSILAIPDAPRELAAGWAFMHGFYDRTSHLARVTARDDRISVMVESGEDIDLRRLEAVGWAKPNSLPTPIVPHEDRFLIEEADFIDVIDATWYAFRKDHSSEGYFHAAIASAGDIHCVTRDRVLEPAVAKALGWKILDGRETATPMLLLRGIPDRRIVEAAARLGISLVVADGVPTNEAFRAALGLSMTVVGMSTARTIGLFVDGGHISLNEGDPLKDGDI